MRALSIDSRYPVVKNLHGRPQASDAWFQSFGTGGSGTADTVSDARFAGEKARRITWSTPPTNSSALFISGASQQTLTAGVNYLVMVRFGATAFPYALTNAAFFSNTFTAVRRRIDNLGDGTHMLREIRMRSGTSESFVISTTGGTFSPPAVGGTFFAGGLAIYDIGASTDLDRYPYYDGDSPSWRWDGTPGASTSRGRVFVP